MQERKTQTRRFDMKIELLCEGEEGSVGIVRSAVEELHKQKSAAQECTTTDCYASEWQTIDAIFSAKQNESETFFRYCIPNDVLEWKSLRLTISKSRKDDWALSWHSNAFRVTQDEIDARVCTLMNCVSDAANDMVDFHVPLLADCANQTVLRTDLEEFNVRLTHPLQESEEIQLHLQVRREEALHKCTARAAGDRLIWCFQKQQLRCKTRETLCFSMVGSCIVICCKPQSFQSVRLRHFRETVPTSPTSPTSPKSRLFVKTFAEANAQEIAVDEARGVYVLPIAPNIDPQTALRCSTTEREKTLDLTRFNRIDIDFSGTIESFDATLYWKHCNVLLFEPKRRHKTMLFCS